MLRLDDFNEAVWLWLEAPAVFGLSRGVLATLCIVGAALGLFLFATPSMDRAFGLR